jgi:hypothetical protein
MAQLGGRLKMAPGGTGEEDSKSKLQTPEKLQVPSATNEVGEGRLASVGALYNTSDAVPRPVRSLICDDCGVALRQWTTEHGGLRETRIVRVQTLRQVLSAGVIAVAPAFSCDSAAKQELAC